MVRQCVCGSRDDDATDTTLTLSKRCELPAELCALSAKATNTNTQQSTQTKLKSDYLCVGVCLLIWKPADMLMDVTNKSGGKAAGNDI